MPEETRLIGVVNGAVFLLILFLLARMEKNYNWHKQTFSYFGCKKTRASKVFNTSVLLYSIFQSVFLWQISTLYQSPGAFIALVLLFSTIPAGILCSYFTGTKSSLIHNLMVGIIIFNSCLGGLIWCWVVLSFHPLIGIMQSLLTIGVIAILIRGVIKRKYFPANYEAVFFGGIFLWNCLNTLPLLTR